MTEASSTFTAASVVVDSDYSEAVLSVEFFAGTGPACRRLLLLFACDEGVAMGPPYHLEFQQNRVTHSGSEIHALTLRGTEVQIEWSPATRQEGSAATDISGLERHRLRVLLPYATPVLTLLRQLIPVRPEVE